MTTLVTVGLLKFLTIEIHNCQAEYSPLTQAPAWSRSLRAGSVQSAPALPLRAPGLAAPAPMAPETQLRPAPAPASECLLMPGSVPTTDNWPSGQSKLLSTT